VNHYLNIVFYTRRPIIKKAEDKNHLIKDVVGMFWDEVVFFSGIIFSWQFLIKFIRILKKETDRSSRGITVERLHMESEGWIEGFEIYDMRSAIKNMLHHIAYHTIAMRNFRI